MIPGSPNWRACGICYLGNAEIIKLLEVRTQPVVLRVNQEEEFQNDSVTDLW